MIVEQRVQVKLPGAEQLYTYAWFWDAETMEPGPLKEGDRVVVPANWRIDEPSRATVMELGSTWEGPTRTLLQKIEDD